MLLCHTEQTQTKSGIRLFRHINQSEIPPCELSNIKLHRPVKVSVLVFVILCQFFQGNSPVIVDNDFTTVNLTAGEKKKTIHGPYSLAMM